MQERAKLKVERFRIFKLQPERVHALGCKWETKVLQKCQRDRFVS